VTRPGFGVSLWAWVIQEALSAILMTWNDGGSGLPDFLTAASLRAKCLDELEFTANQSVGGIRHGGNKEPRRFLRLDGPVANRDCCPRNWSN
jgi:hypothetical protein